MGGSYRGIGNVTPYAEFNFSVDLEAANCIFSNTDLSFTLIPWEVYKDYKIPLEWYDKWLTQKSKAAEFLERIGR